MFEIRIHGFGGEGVVKLSEMIGKAATKHGQWAHSLPFFGTEMRGASVKAFTRVDQSPINVKSYIYRPDFIIVTNDLLLSDPETLRGLKKEGGLLLNSSKNREQIDRPRDARLFSMNATRLAYDLIGKPMVNVILLGAFVGITDLLPLSVVQEIVAEEFGGGVEQINLQALNRGYEMFRKVS